MAYRAYYDKQQLHSVRKDPRGGFNLLDYVMLVVTVIVIVGVGLSWATQWINPARYGAMAALGLVMPLLFAANFVCLLYWIISWKKMAFAPLTVLVVFLWGVGLYFKPALAQSYADSSTDRSLITVMSYNVHGMVKPPETGGPRSFAPTMDNIIKAVDSLRPAILCMQEFVTTAKYPTQYFETAIPLLAYNIAHYNAASGENTDSGVAIYSRYPIVRSGHLDFAGSTKSTLWADIAVSGDTVRVFNAHLQTTSITDTDQEFIVNMDFVTDSTRTSKFRQMVGKLRNNFILRASQADSLALSIASSPYPVVVCGDFNDPPVSYTYRQISRGLRDSFREAGSGYGYSFRGFFNLLRIDYVLHSKSIECVEYTSPDLAFSDHNPVVSRLRLHKN
ncbi:MAG: endonuclease/exonuclease/phosphatase family protein [Rikenellaceae bacterium]|jgi:endonuclease/exonuclease/phosphatase family metal-dependent hydrolase|nr:endonuclease/exonuclease/phosphatase family protein [Rikenellaceae bacterium]